MALTVPTVLILLPAIAAVAALVLGRRPRAAVVVGLAAVALLWLVLFLADPSGGLLQATTWTVYGRVLQVTAGTRSALLLVYPAVALLLALAGVWPQSRGFVPSALAVLTPLAALLLTAEASLGAVLVVVVVAALLPALYGGRFVAAAAAWRAILLIAIAVAPLLLAAWLVAAGQTAQPAGRLAVLVAVLILLGGFPFHIWVAGVARNAPPFALPLALAVAQTGIALYAFGLIDAAPAVRTSVEFQGALRWSAVATTLLAAFLMLRARSREALVPPAVVLEMGFFLLLALAPGAAGTQAVLTALSGRFVALVLVAVGLAWPDGWGQRRGRRWTAAAQPLLLGYGLLSLVGLPLTPGMSGRWLELTAAGLTPGSTVGPWVPALLILALAAATWAVLRKLLEPAGVAAEAQPGPGRGAVALVVVVLAAGALLALFPQLLLQ